ncbi:MAG TPA: quinoprotein dehydrogenase-associated SoxYZ-like carrier [Stellaceae bacterium]|nr:quinoprotein dehydrogenase-associated SoxYZ-like carrier [Stellaceae bacterium]
MRLTPMVLGIGVLLATAVMAPASAEVDEAARAARWANLRSQIFGDRALQDGAGVLTIEAPDRAEDAALVPVKIGIAGELRRDIAQLYFVIDDNPSPLAGRFAFGPAADPSAIAIRVRVDDYTNLHAVAETKDGRLYAVARFIKAAGGCSAPAGKDQALAMQRLGQMKMTMKGSPRLGEPLEAHLLVSHPNNSGMQMDQVTRNYVPADFVRTIRLRYNDRPLLTMESDISISEDPSLTFAFVPSVPSGAIEAAVEDSSNRHFERSWPVKVEPGT